jgi:hypothetical protein
MVKIFINNLLLGCCYLLVNFLLFRNIAGGDILFMASSWIMILIHFLISVFKKAEVKVKLIKILAISFLVSMVFSIIYGFDKTRPKSDTKVVTDD